MLCLVRLPLRHNYLHRQTKTDGQVSRHSEGHRLTFIMDIDDDFHEYTWLTFIHKSWQFSLIRLVNLHQLQACLFPGVVFPPLPLSALSSSHFYCTLQDGFGQTWWTGNMTIPLHFDSLYDRQEVFVWSDCLLDLGIDFLVGNMVCVWSLYEGRLYPLVTQRAILASNKSNERNLPWRNLQHPPNRNLSA